MVPGLDSRPAATKVHRRFMHGPEPRKGRANKGPRILSLSPSLFLSSLPLSSLPPSGRTRTSGDAKSAAVGRSVANCGHGNRCVAVQTNEHVRTFSEQRDYYALPSFLPSLPPFSKAIVSKLPRVSSACPLRSLFRFSFPIPAASRSRVDPTIKGEMRPNRPTDRPKRAQI